jgi:hypothetical protein
MKKKYFIYLLIIPFLLLALFFNKNKILSYDEKFGYPLKKLVRSIKGNDIYDYSTDNIKTKFLNIIHQQDQNLVDVNKVKDFDYSWLDNNKFLFIAHRLGNVFIGGENTLKTFKASIKEGHKYFETDLVFTKDDKLILYHPTPHDIKNDIFAKDYTFNEFRVLKKDFDVPKFDELVNEIRDKDLFIITDTDDLERMIRYIKTNYDIKIIKKIIPQIYSFDQINLIDHQIFPGPIFTSYASKMSTQDIIKSAIDYKIKAITLTPYRLAEVDIKFEDRVKFFTHAVDNPFEAINYKLNGIDGIYSKILNKKNFGIIELINDDLSKNFSP